MLHRTTFLRLYLFFQVLACLVNFCVVTAADINPNSTSIPTATLSNGITIPLVGLGCASGVRYQHVLTALEAGYRYLDTAQAKQWGYQEEEVAAAVAEATRGKILSSRRDVFITTKIHPENLGYKATQRAVQQSLDLPGFEGYLNAVLIHKPRCWEGACTRQPEGTWQESWKALEEFYLEGKVGAIGICDVDEHLLKELLQQSIPPQIIQNWFDPFHQTPAIRQKIQDAGILFQAYSTLGTQWKYIGGGMSENPVMTNPVLLQLAKKYDVASPGPIVLQWAVRKNISVLPASRNAQRQSSNLHSSFDFTLSNDDMAKIDALDGQVQREDPNQVAVTFINPSNDVTTDVYWMDMTTNKEVPIGSIEAGKDLSMKSYHGHTFVFRDKATGEMILQHDVERQQGKQQRIVVEREDDEEL